MTLERDPQAASSATVGPVWDGSQLAALAARHGTPYFLYDLDAALAHLARLIARLPAAASILYAMKANANARVLECLRGRVGGLDVSSIGEVRLARAAGHAAAAMSFAGPGKTDDELREALALGVGLISVESPGELQRLSVHARQLGRRAAITLRINPAHIPNAFMMKMGGQASQFGIAEEELEQPLRAALADPALELHGLHVYAGTQCLDAAAILENVRATLALVARLAGEHAFTPRVVNLGGGFGIPYFAGQEPLEVDPLAEQLGELLAQVQATEPRFAATRFLLELGRYLIGPYGIYVARVVEVKATRGKRFAILDGGMNHCFAATGNFGQLVKKNYAVSNLTHPHAAPERQELVGPLCTPLDSLARAIELPRADPGDLVAFHACGAYTFSASPLLFLGHDTPVELVQHEGEVTVGRRRLAASHFA